MRLPLWLIALLFLGYSIWAVRCWGDHMCQCETQISAPAPKETTGEPLFNWNASTPVADAKFPDWKRAFLATGGQGDTLLINGWYRSGETDGEKLALARAEAIKNLLMPEIPGNRIRTAAKLVDDDGLKEGSDPMASAGFDWLKMVLAQDKGAIIESDKDITFLFPFNSTERDRDENVETYLKKLVEKHKLTKATFSLVGHADNVGSDASNQKLGLDRANAIARSLIKYGIDKSRITVQSKGKAEPVASNDTEDGRHQNRRVVITVNN